jgi:hypothetical protein
VEDEMVEKEMRGFEDLECYQLAMNVFRVGYKVASLLPPEEKYNLSDQIRRAATSIILNIAEGYVVIITWIVCSFITLRVARSWKF